MPQRTRNWLVPLAWVAGIGAALLIVFPLGFPNYDTIYALVWGRELAHGVSPDYGAALPPTPHPLADLLGAVTTPLGDGAITVTMIVAYVSLALVGYLVYRLGSLWFDRPIGAVAAAIVLTRAPFLSNGLRAYVDVPYIALVLGALVIETRKPRAGWPVLALLALAGLLRPEAWLFSVAYLGYLALTPERSPESPGEEARMPLERADTQNAGLIRPAFVRARGILVSPRGLGLIALALAAPICWVLFDGITTGNFLYSLTGTQETVETLKRHTGPVDLVLWGPRALGEVMQWPGMVGAAGGIALGFAFLRKRSALGLFALVLAFGAFALLAAAGLAIIARYTMLGGAILAIFVAVGLLGWRLLDAGHPWRRGWQVFAGVVVLMFVLWLPNQWDLDSTVHSDLADQGTIERDLSDLADSGAFAKPLCGPIAVPNHRAVPRLAFNLDVKPTDVVSASEEGVPRRGYFLKPASPFVIHNFILDPNDPTSFELNVPHGFERVAANDSWVLYRRC
ncbi:MAG TPA: glycosyltransferase family 39 protein [Solirubrobacterales bacterium]|nr:glycosyltransferase family 39 protein [Solirubrobacterales bacterium]